MNPTVIVCPIGCADADDPLLAQAVALARWYDAVLHVVQATGTGGRSRAGRLVAAGDPHHLRLLDVVAAHRVAGLRIVAAVAEGEAVAAVVAYARRRSADLLVVGSSGWAGVGDWSHGAFAAATARATGRPTLTIPEGHVLRGGGADVPFRRIVSAVDFTHASVRAAHEALALAQQGAGHVTLLHVLDAFPGGPTRVGALARVGEYAAHVDRLNRELARLASPEAVHWCEIETQTAAGAVHDTVASVAAAQRADLVVLGVTVRSRLARLVSGSTVDRVLRRASRPVLIVPGPAGLAAALGDRRLVVGGTERAI